MNGIEKRARLTILSPEEDPNAAMACSSPPCFMHELDPSYLGYLGPDEVRGLLEALLRVHWSGTVIEVAWLRAMLRRHLARSGATGAATPYCRESEASTEVGLAAQPSDALARQAVRLRDALPRLADHVLRRDLADALMVLERDLRWPHRDEGAR